MRSSNEHGTTFRKHRILSLTGSIGPSDTHHNLSTAGQTDRTLLPQWLRYSSNTRGRNTPVTHTCRILIISMREWWQHIHLVAQIDSNLSRKFLTQSKNLHQDYKTDAHRHLRSTIHRETRNRPIYFTIENGVNTACATYQEIQETSLGMLLLLSCDIEQTTTHRRGPPEITR